MRIICAALALGLACGVANALPTVSSDSVKAFRAAIVAADRGERGHAVAIVDCLLMPRKVTVGTRDTGDAAAVREAVQIWNDRLPDRPLRFSEGGRPDVSVSVVPEIESGADIQGRIDFHRLVRWGDEGDGYKVDGNIRICRETNGRPLDHDEMVCVRSHELGHLLGLADDFDRSAVMGPFVAGQPVVGPTDREASEVAAFRRSLASFRRELLYRPVWANRHGRIGFRKRGRRR